MISWEVTLPVREQSLRLGRFAGRTFRTEADGASAAPPTDCLVVPMSARLKQPITQREPWQRSNQRVDDDLRESASCALG